MRTTLCLLLATLSITVSSAINAFTWDERGRLWTLALQGDSIRLETAGRGPWVIKSKRAESSSLLVHDNQIFFGEEDSIRRFKVAENLDELDRLALPNAGAKVLSLKWGPLNHIYLAYRGADESGIMRVDLKSGVFEQIAKGIDAEEMDFDDIGQLYAVDSESRLVFHVAPGFDYANGLDGYSKRDVALKTPGISPWAIVAHNDELVLFDRPTQSLKVFRVTDNGVEEGRALTRLDNAVDVRQMQIGPDGALHMLTRRKSETMALASFGLSDSSHCPTDLSKLSGAELAAQLSHSNRWQRETALRTIGFRGEFSDARGLHPNTPLHEIFQNDKANPLARVAALRGMHIVGLLDDTNLENGFDYKEWQLRATAVELIGERRLPTHAAFMGMEKNGATKATNNLVRRAVMVAARRFVSGDFIADTTPPIAIREVFTGGIMSGLWFSAENGSTPEYNLLYWNALRPITAFDQGHAIGFFQGDDEMTMDMGHWLMERLGRQVGEGKDPGAQEDALVMLTNVKPANRKLIARAFTGIKDGVSRQKTKPTAKSREVVSAFSRNEDSHISALAKDVLAAWDKQ